MIEPVFKSSSKVSFQIVNCLRFGVTPCFVIEGAVDPAKKDCLNFR